MKSLTQRTTAPPSFRASQRSSAYTSRETSHKDHKKSARSVPSIDYTPIEEQKYERLLVQNTNQWLKMHSSQKKLDQVEKESLSKLMFRSLREGANQYEDQFETDQHYMTPSLNLHVLNAIDTEGAIQPPSIDDTESKSKKNMPSATQDMKKLFINRKIVNDVLFTKLRKQQNGKQIDLKSPLNEKDIREALSSFKNLTTVIPHLSSVINYNDVQKRINDTKQTAPKVVDRILHNNWEKQQRQFDQIVESQLEKLGDLMTEIAERKSEIYKLRKQSFDIRGTFEQLNERAEEVQSRFQRKIYMMSHQSKDLSKEQQQAIKKIKEQRESELMVILNQIQNQKLQIAANNELIIQQEKYIRMIKQQKDHIKEELTLFLKIVLKSDELYLFNGLTDITKHLFRLKNNVQMIDFPGYLDEESKQYLLKVFNQLKDQRTQLELEEEALQQSQRQNGRSASQIILSSGFGVRPQFESKLAELKAKMADFKKENSRVYKSQTQQSKIIMNDKKVYKEIRSGSPPPKTKNDNLLDNPLADPSTFKSNLLKIENVKLQLDEVTKNEINRLKQQNQQKSITTKIVTITHALFGRKKMAEILMSLFGQNCLLTIGESQPDKSHLLRKHITQMTDNIRAIEQKLNFNQEVNFKYDMLYNQMPTITSKIDQNFFV